MFMAEKHLRDYSNENKNHRSAGFRELWTEISFTFTESADGDRWEFIFNVFNNKKLTLQNKMWMDRVNEYWEWNNNPKVKFVWFFFLFNFVFKTKSLSQSCKARREILQWKCIRWTPRAWASCMFYFKKALWWISFDFNSETRACTERHQKPIVTNTFLWVSS